MRPMGVRLMRFFLAALPALALAGPCAAEPLGRLFFTPEQRATLESLRLAPTTAATAASTDRVTVNGIIQRSGGPATVWINGVPETVPAKSVVGVGKSGAPAVRVPVPGQDQQVKLKVGQTIEISEPAPDEGSPGTDGAASPGRASPSRGSPDQAGPVSPSPGPRN